MSHTQPGLDHRHRDKDGEISKKHGNTLISTLRKVYGPTFAPNFQPHQRLSEVLQTLDEPSLSQRKQFSEFHSNFSAALKKSRQHITALELELLAELYLATHTPQSQKTPDTDFNALLFHVKYEMGGISVDALEHILHLVGRALELQRRLLDREIVIEIIESIPQKCSAQATRLKEILAQVDGNRDGKAASAIR